MSGQNVLIVMSDEHMRDASGCYGHPVVKTPNLDKLAARGTRFDNAYTPAPICVPARASIATGRYVHQNRFWSNAQPYDGSQPGWGHKLIEAGHHVASVGKLHYRSTDDDNGFLSEAHSLHVRNGIGWVRGLIRKDAPVWGVTEEFSHNIGAGECDYTVMDRDITRDACHWLRYEAGEHTDKPWVLFTSYITPHYPLVVPQEFYDLYPAHEMELPRAVVAGDGTDNPVVQGIRRLYNYDDHFDDERRRIAVASYYGMCSYLDHNIGQVLRALEDSGQADNTLVIYVSDHGEMLGTKGMWTKGNMYEESVAIPMIMAGASIPKGKAVTTPTSLIDLHPTILEATGLGAGKDIDRPGENLIQIANSDARDRAILSEYHDGGSITGMFMVRVGRWKYCYYPGYDPQLFDMEDDRLETRDLGTDLAYAETRAQCHAALFQIVDADAANDQAFADQAMRIEELGGMDAIIAMDDYDFTPVEK
ncbi:MAG: sulfatase-like hydrolase/transferase [Rhodospirillales bacterium]|nr:sulfatase-like hydrolase/transferase [Rhodospirillales bacterium]